MSINGLSGSQNFYHTASRKNYAAYKNERKDFSVASKTPTTKEDVKESFAATTITAEDFNRQEHQGIPYLNADVMESVNRQMAIARASKQQGQLDTIAGLYRKYIGDDADAPKKYEDITETDFALYRLFEQSGINGGYKTLVGMYPNTMYDMNDQPIGFSHMDKNAFSMALMKENLDAFYSDDGINQAIDKLNLPDTVDRDVLFKAMKSLGTEQLSLLDNNIEKAIDSIASLDAEKISGIISSEARSDSDIESLKSSFKGMIRESMKFATNIIRQGDMDDFENINSYLEQLKEYSYANGTVKFHIGDNIYTRQELEDGYKQILLGNASKLQIPKI